PMEGFSSIASSYQWKDFLPLLLPMERLSSIACVLTIGALHISDRDSQLHTQFKRNKRCTKNQT
ncbi:MAG: hypothetical protein ORN83_05285, partial [Chthoniobacteraceae bacterium]|nr:hypothetical protein [Chthoniobacteraceae bacterium]